MNLPGKLPPETLNLCEGDGSRCWSFRWGCLQLATMGFFCFGEALRRSGGRLAGKVSSLEVELRLF